MLNTFEAILHGDHLAWRRGAPEPASQDEAVDVLVTVLNGQAPGLVSSRGEQMAAALARLADRDALPDITDPRHWQREVRRDRELPGRKHSC